MRHLIWKLAVAILGPCAAVGTLTSGAAAFSDHKEEIVAVSRSTETTASTSSGVSVEGLQALVEVGAGRPGGAGPKVDCSWGVMHDPSQPFGGGERIYRLGLDRQGYEGAFTEYGPYIGGQVHRFTETDEFAASGQDVTRLRYVYNYGPDCAQLVQAWITLADIEAVAQIAFDDLQRSWPSQDVALGWPEPVEDTWTALRTSLPWQPISATASDGGITVTVTATPVQTAWDIGEVNGRYGGTTEVVCPGPGDMPVDQSLASCKVWFAGPSTGLSDRNGVGDTTSLGLTVTWLVGYTSTFGSDPAWLIWPTSTQLDALRVLTSQSVNVSAGG